VIKFLVTTDLDLRAISIFSGEQSCLRL